MEESGETEDLKLACLLLWRVWLVDSQGIPAGVRGWDNKMSGGRVGGEDLHDQLEMINWAERRERLQQVVYRDGGKIEDWPQRRGKRGEDLQLA